jgi:hypothetical protein
MRELAQAMIESLPPDMIPKLEAEFRRGWHMEAVEAVINQKQIAQNTHQEGTLRSVDGLGRLRLRIDATVFHYWGQRLGYACWRDKEFVNQFERDNPEARVRSGGTRLQVGYHQKGSRK